MAELLYRFNCYARLCAKTNVLNYWDRLSNMKPHVHWAICNSCCVTRLPPSWFARVHVFSKIVYIRRNTQFNFFY